MMRFICLITLLSFFHPHQFAAAQQPTPPARETAAPNKPKVPAENNAATAEKPAAAPIEEGEVSFDNLLDPELYLAYGEARNVGQQFMSGDIAGLVHTALKMDLLPIEAQTVMVFVNSHTEELAGARLMFAAMRATESAKTPQMILALEFPAVPDAEKFEAPLRQFLRAASVLAPAGKKNARPLQVPSASYFLQRKGNLLLLSDDRFELKDLKKADGPTLAEDPHYQTIKARLATESLFFYVNTGQVARRYREQMERAHKQAREQQAKAAENEKAADPDAAAAAETMPPIIPTEKATPPEAQFETPPPPVVNEPAAAEEAAQELAQQDPPAVGSDQTIVEAPPGIGAAAGGGADSLSVMLPMMFGGFIFGGGGGDMTQWPAAVGVGFAFEGESLVIRSLMTENSGTSVNPLPLFSFLRSGPPLALEAPSMMPDNTQMMVSASLDLPYIFESFLRMSPRGARAGGEISAGETNRAEEEIAALEKKFGFNIRRDLLPVFGPEVAVALPLKDFLSSSAPKSASEEGAPPAPGFLIYLSLRDKSAAQNLLPRALEAFGMKGAGQMLAKETVGDAEMYNLPGTSLAFINNFLILAPDARDVRLAVDAFNRRQTLSGGKEYADAAGWQPSQKLGQAYVSESMMADFIAQTKRALGRSNEATRAAYADYNPEPKPLTLAVSAEGAGVLHEIRIPKNLLTSAVARAVADNNKMPFAKNEDEAAGALRNLYYAQMQYFMTDEKRTYATLDQLMKDESVSRQSDWERMGYRVEVSAAGEKFEATATPRQYGTTGLLSFFIDETGVLRGADHGGQRATASDKPVAQ